MRGDVHESVSRQRAALSELRAKGPGAVVAVEGKRELAPCVHRGERLEDQLCDGCKSSRKPTAVWWCDLLGSKCALRRLMEPGEQPVKRDAEIVICWTCEKYRRKE